MDERELAVVRARSKDFAAGVFAGLRRSGQRTTCLRYLRGLSVPVRRFCPMPQADPAATKAACLTNPSSFAGRHELGVEVCHGAQALAVGDLAKSCASSRRGWRKQVCCGNLLL
ncbi:hypothetical protein AB0B83_27195 [Micromonospora sp. NPDC049060]|uniref:hypothetical protein n=1 Tax=Micromonospora sp. NPDC049060 TaxID=3154828 RepID=UPI0033FFF22D